MFTIVTEETPKCHVSRSKSGKVRCELPPDHSEGHFGRDRRGAWHSWGPSK